MASMKDNKINKIVRIDLGARERFAIAKMGKEDPFVTSIYYQRSGINTY
jgi:hypothetical protein